MMKRGAWGTRFGFYLAAIGSACGLGNLWRFPYVVGENGGGAFVLLYVFFAMLIGLPILIAELMLGRTRRQSILAIMADLTNKTKKQYIWIARFAIGLNLVVLSYYAVISGWVLHFLMRFREMDRLYDAVVCGSALCTSGAVGFFAVRA
jgi:NSS family neurotransmitter:Na+ symporter